MGSNPILLKEIFSINLIILIPFFRLAELVLRHQRGPDHPHRDYLCGGALDGGGLRRLLPLLPPTVLSALCGQMVPGPGSGCGGPAISGSSNQLTFLLEAETRPSSPSTGTNFLFIMPFLYFTLCICCLVRSKCCGEGVVFGCTSSCLMHVSPVHLLA